MDASALRRRLRPGVDLIEQGSTAEIIDTLTGLSFCIEGEALADEAEVCAALSSLGLLDEGLVTTEVCDRQRVFRTRQVLEFVSERVPYYRDRKAQYSPAAIQSLADLQRLPLMRKSDLRRAMPHGLIADDIDVAARLEDGSLTLSATSGTTDERVQVLSDMELDVLPSRFEAIWNLKPSEERYRTAVFTSPTCMGAECHLGRASLDKRIRGGYTLFLNSTDDLFSLTRQQIEDIAAELAEFRPDLFMVNPFYLHWLARKAQEHGIALPPARLVISTYQYLSALQRRSIRDLLNAPVYDFYGATDMGGCLLAIECHQGRLHVREDHSLLETVDAEGRPLTRGSGALGAIAVTTLENRVAPLVRYLPGDLGRFTGETCTCAASGWACLELHGRSNDVLWCGDRPITTRQIDDSLAGVRALEFYKCTQIAPSELLMQVIPSLDVRVDPAEIEDRLRGLGFATVRTKTVTRLDPEPSLKFRLTESRITPVRRFA